MSNLKLPLIIGQDYLTRGGWRARVVADDMRPVHKALVVHYIEENLTHVERVNLDGRVNPLVESPYDLIAEWVNPPKPLECWVVLATDGVRLATFDEKSQARNWANLYGYTIKPMREVFE